MVDRPTFLALIVKLAADSRVIPKHLIPAIPTATFEFEGMTPGPPNQLGPFSNKNRINRFYVAESHIKLFYIIIEQSLEVNHRQIVIRSDKCYFKNTNCNQRYYGSKSKF